MLRAAFHMQATLLLILARLREPSTMAAIGVLIALFGGSAGLSQGVAQIVGGLAAVLGVVLPEVKAGEPSVIEALRGKLGL